MHQIVQEVESATQKEKQYVADKSIGKIAERDQKDRQLDILFKEDLLEISVCKAKIHKNRPEKKPTQRPHFCPHMNPKVAVMITSRFGAIPPNASHLNTVDCRIKHSRTVITIKIFRFISFHPPLYKTLSGP